MSFSFKVQIYPSENKIPFSRHILFIYLVVQQGLWDHSSMIRDQTYPTSTPVKVLSSNHWTVREFPHAPFYMKYSNQISDIQKRGFFFFITMRRTEGIYFQTNSVNNTFIYTLL